MKTVRIDFCDFWPGFRKDDNRIYNLLKTQYAVEIHDRPDFLIYSSFGHHHRLYSCIRIFFSGESLRPDFSTCDYAFTCHYLDDPRHLRWPLYAYYYGPDILLRDGADLDEIMAAKTRFCCFIASNSHPRKTRKRNAFFHRLSRYKKVDAGGRVFNNIGYLVLGGPWGKIEFLKQYKFNIAFENASIPGYTTEKIVEPMAARCVPIYWGNPWIHREFNPKSFLNYFDSRDEAALIERIIELDQNDGLYRQYLAEPCFHQNTPNEFFQLDRVLGHFDMIFSHSIKPVAQRRRLFSLKLGQRIRQILSRMGRDAVAPEPIPPALALRGKLLERYKIDIVLDVGANTGQYGKELRAIGYKGKIVSFEPLSSAYKELLKTANSDRSWKALSFALGDTEGKAVLNIAGNSMSSSILDMLPSHVKSAPESQYIGKEQVEVRTLDSVFDAICSQEQNILLKIDTQGFEKHVLDGAERSLRFINTIQLEMSLTPLYQGELLFPELSQLLYQKGYRLASIEPGFADRETGQLLQIDGIFHR